MDMNTVLPLAPPHPVHLLPPETELYSKVKVKSKGKKKDASKGKKKDDKKK